MIIKKTERKYHAVLGNATEDTKVKYSNTPSD